MDQKTYGISFKSITVCSMGHIAHHRFKSLLRWFSLSNKMLGNNLDGKILKKKKRFIMNKKIGFI